MLPPAQLLPFGTTTADTQLIVGSFLLRGWSFIETTGSAAAIVNLIDGPDVNAPLIVPIGLSQSESTRDAIPGAGLLIRTGIFLDVVSGSVRGSLWITALTTDDDHAWAHGTLGLTYLRSGI